jgi:hypothetical protein
MIAIEVGGGEVQWIITVGGQQRGCVSTGSRGQIGFQIAGVVIRRGRNGARGNDRGIAVVCEIAGNQPQGNLGYDP